MTSPPDLSRLKIDRAAPPAPRRRSPVRTGAIVVAIVLAAGAIASRTLRSAPLVETVTAAATSTTGTSSAGSTSVTANGYVVARTKASVSAKIAGRLAYLAVSEGSLVSAGDVIARLDNADYEASVAQAQANLASADASVIEAASDAEQMVREANRLRDIRIKNAQLISPQDLEQAESRSAQAAARQAASQARRRAAQASLQLAQASMDNTIIRAPFAGTVLRKDAEVGEVVAPSVGGGLTRGAVVTLADLSTLEVEVDVNESYIARITGGLEARITLDAYPDTAFRGRVRQVVPTADRQRATVQVKVSILEHDPRILPEMGAKVDFLQPAVSTTVGSTSATRAAVRIPSTLIRTDSGASVVFIVRDDKLVRRPVTTGPVSGGFVEVRSGLSGGERLLSTGVDAPKDGMRVKVKQ